MTMRFPPWRALWALFWCNCLFAQTPDVAAPAPAPAASALVTATSSTQIAGREGVAFTLQLTDAGVIPQSLFGKLSVLNTNTRTLVVESITIKPVGRLTRMYHPFVADKTEHTVDANSSEPFDFALEVKDTVSLWDHLRARSGPADFEVELKYSWQGAGRADAMSVPAKLTVETSNWYVFVGGAVGAVLLVSFMLSSKVLKHAQSGTLYAMLATPGPIAAKWALLYIAFAVNGLVVALLLVIFSAGLSAFAVPIGIKLQDFSGGVLVGLFSVSLGKFLAEKLNLL